MSTAAAEAPAAYSKVLSGLHWLVAPAFLGSVGAVLVAQQKKGKEKGGRSAPCRREAEEGVVAGVVTVVVCAVFCCHGRLDVPPQVPGAA